MGWERRSLYQGPSSCVMKPRCRRPSRRREWRAAARTSAAAQRSGRPGPTAGMPRGSPPPGARAGPRERRGARRGCLGRSRRCWWGGARAGGGAVRTRDGRAPAVGRAGALGASGRILLALLSATRPRGAGAWSGGAGARRLGTQQRRGEAASAWS